MTYILDSNDKPDPQELAHYGVKGMRWGVRRSEGELSRSRQRKQAKAEKTVSREQERLDKWAAKKVSKGKGEKKLAKLEKQTKRRYKQELLSVEGRRVRKERFDALVEKEMKKDPNFTKTMTSSERKVLETKAANKALSRAYVSSQAKKAAVSTVVDKTVKSKIDMNNLDPGQQLMVQGGLMFVSSFTSSMLTRSEAKTIAQINSLNAVENRNARAEALRKQLNKG